MAGRGKAMTLPAWAAGQAGSVPGASSALSSSSSSAAAAAPMPQAAGAASPSMFLDASGAGLDRANLAPPSITPATQEALVRSALSIAGYGFGASIGVGAADPSTRSGRRLYVGNLPMGVTEPEIMAFFTEVMMKVYSPQPGLVLSATVKPDRGFGFVEFNSQELASAAMSLDGVTFKGQPLKMQRPSDYSPEVLPPQGPPPKLNLQALGIVSTQVPDSPNKVFIGGIPYHITEEQLKELLQAFGPLSALHLVKDPGATQSKGYGFCEYMDPAVTDNAVAGLNDLEIVPGRTLTVRRANPKGAPASAPPAAPALVPPPAAPAMPVSTPSGSVPPPQPTGSTPTSVLRLSNMTTPADLANPTELAEIEQEVKEACAAHGSVLSVTIPTHGSAAGVVFVKFGTPSQAAAAGAALGGKTFDSRIVGASFANEAQVASGVFV